MIETSTTTSNSGFGYRNRENMNFEGGNMQAPSGNNAYKPGN